MKLRIRKMNSYEILFFVALFLYCAHTYLSASVFGMYSSSYSGVGGVHFPKSFFSLLRYAIVIIGVFKILLTTKYTKKVFGILATLVVLVAGTIISSGDNNINLVLALVIVFAGRDIDFERIIRLLMGMIIFWNAVIMLSCLFGIIPNLSYTVEGESIYSLGFSYFSTPAYCAMTVSIMYIYLSRKVSYFKLVIVEILNILYYQVHNTELAIYVVTLFVILYVIVVKWGVFSFEKRFLKGVATIAPFLCFILTLVFVYLYSIGKLPEIETLSTLYGRLEYSAIALNEYGIHLFGQHIVTYGNTARVYGSATSGFFIDSGYMKVLLTYGLLFTIFLLLLYVLLYRYIYTSKDKIMYIWCGLMLVASIINGFLLSPLYNPALFIMPKAIFDISKSWRKA